MNITLFPIWSGQTVICIAGGPSLTKGQVKFTKGCKIIAINDAYKLAPQANILYACDNQWWEWHKGVPDFKGYKLQHDHEVPDENRSRFTATYPGIDCILSDGASGFSDRMDRIRTGGNSGYQALHIALQLGAKRIILLGYDMHASGEQSHWFGEHPNGRQPNERYGNWIKEFPALQKIANDRGVKIYNCSPDSALECFEKRGIGGLLF